METKFPLILLAINANDNNFYLNCISSAFKLNYHLLSVLLDDFHRLFELFFDFNLQNEWNVLDVRS